MSRLFSPVMFASFQKSSLAQTTRTWLSTTIETLPLRTGQQNTHSFFQQSSLKQRLYRLRHQPIVIGGGIWLTLLAWNWNVAVAIAAGITTATVVYLIQLNRLHVTWFQRFPQNKLEAYQKTLQQGITRLAQQWPKLWTPANRPLSIAIISGASIATVVSLILRLYQEMHSLSIALILGSQPLIIGIIGLLVWRQQHLTTPRLASHSSLESIADHPAPPTEIAYSTDTIWAELTSTDTPTRLVAIYRAVDWAQAQFAPSTPDSRSSNKILVSVNDSSLNGPNTQTRRLEPSKLMACFRVMLSHETNPTVKQALRDALMVLQDL